MRRNMFFLCVCALLAGLQTANAERYTAQLLDAGNRQPVAYANIGVLGADIGINSDSAGYFGLELGAAEQDKYLVVSMIGYEEYKVKVSEFTAGLSRNDHKVYLKKKGNILQEVVIRPAKLTVARLGNDVVCDTVRTKDNKGQGSVPFPFLFQRKKKGTVQVPDTLTEIGTLMKVKRRKTFIDSVQINIGYCTHEKILYRLNIYEEVKDRFENILQEPIYIMLNREQVGRSIRVDLTGRNLVVHNNFIVSLEKVKDLGPGEMSICGKLFGAAMYMRIASHHERFIKLPVIGMGLMAYVTFSEEEK